MLHLYGIKINLIQFLTNLNKIVLFEKVTMKKLKSKLFIFNENKS